MGCSDSVIKSILSYAIEKNQVEIGLANNFLEFFFPYNIDLEFQDVVKRAQARKHDPEEDGHNFRKIIEDKFKDDTVINDLKKAGLKDFKANLKIVKDFDALRKSLKNYKI